MGRSPWSTEDWDVSSLNFSPSEVKTENLHIYWGIFSLDALGPNPNFWHYENVKNSIKFLTFSCPFLLGVFRFSPHAAYKLVNALRIKTVQNIKLTSLCFLLDLDYSNFDFLSMEYFFAHRLVSLMGFSDILLSAYSLSHLKTGKYLEVKHDE